MNLHYFHQFEDISLNHLIVLNPFRSLSYQGFDENDSSVCQRIFELFSKLMLNMPLNIKFYTSLRYCSYSSGVRPE